MGEKLSAYRVLVENLEGKRLLGRHRSNWKDNIKLILKKKWLRVDCICLSQYRVQWRALVNTVMNLPILYNT